MKLKKPVSKLNASKIMTRPVEYVRLNDSVSEVVQLFSDKNISAAAVVDTKGKAVGVITKTDIVRYEQDMNGIKILDKADLKAPYYKDQPKQNGYHVVNTEETVQSWMTPVIFSVKAETSIKEIARKMVRYGIHHIFVRGLGEPLIGIVSSFDVLRIIASKGPAVS
jgi:CBS domain-containing protein